MNLIKKLIKVKKLRNNPETSLRDYICSEQLFMEEDTLQCLRLGQGEMGMVSSWVITISGVVNFRDNSDSLMLLHFKLHPCVAK